MVDELQWGYGLEVLRKRLETDVALGIGVSAVHFGKPDPQGNAP